MSRGIVSCASHPHVPVAFGLALAIAAIAGTATIARGPQAASSTSGQRLALYAGPNPAVAPSEEGVYVYVQVIDLTGDPVMTSASSSSPIVVTFTSSDPSILRPYGRDGYLATLDKTTCGRGMFVTQKTGTATITATAPGFDPVSVTINAVPPSANPTRLKFWVLPPRAVPGCRPLFIVQMLSAEGRPAQPKFHTPIAIESSSPQVAQASGLYFSRDFTTAQASISVKDAIGTTTLTASAEGLASDSARFAVVPLATPRAVTAPAPPTPATVPASRPAEQPSADALEKQAYQLGYGAAQRAEADPPNAEKTTAERYQQALSLSPDTAIQQRLTDAFRRGYRAAQAQAAPATPPPAQPQTGAGGSPRIFNVTAARNVAWGKPVGPADTFTPETNPIFVWFQYAGLAPKTKITSVWYYLDTATPTRIEEASAVTEQPADSGQFSLELGAGKVWPEGGYRVDLLLDGRVATAARFRVTRAGAGAPPAEPRAYTHPRSGFQIVPPAGWTLDDQVPNADVRMKPEQGEALMEITSGPSSTKLDAVSYAAGWESVSVGPEKLLKRKRAGRATSVDGENAYEGVYDGDGVLVKVIFVGLPARFFVMTGVFRADDFNRGEPVFDRVVQSFRARR